LDWHSRERFAGSHVCDVGGCVSPMNIGERGSQVSIRIHLVSHSPCFSSFSSLFSHKSVERTPLSRVEQHLFQGTMFAAFLSLVLIVALASAQDVEPSSIRRRVTCTNTYKCPPYSSRTPGRECYDTINDCTCDRGYRKEGDYCVKERSCDFKCPPYSSRTPGRECYDTFNDCTCDRGYRKEGDYCVKDRNCDYKCPPYSSPAPGQRCIDGFGDCTCDRGYKKEGDYCKK
jgi:hypothetical protein